MRGFKTLLFGLLLTVVCGGGQFQKVELNPRLTFAKGSVKPGERVEGTLTLTIPSPYHVNANPASEDYLIPTEFKSGSSKHYQIKNLRYPKPLEKTFEFSPDKPLKVYEGKAEIRFQLQVSKNAPPGALKVTGKLRYQACDDKACYPPLDRTVTGSIRVVKPKAAEKQGAAGTQGRGGEKATALSSGQPNGRVGEKSVDVWKFGGMEGKSPKAPSPKAPSPERQTSSLKPQTNSQTRDFAGRVEQEFKQGRWFLFFALLLIGGLGLNLTPCVFPLIPITLGFFGMQAQGQRARRVALTGVYALSMAATYAALGTAAAVAGKAFGFQFQNPWFVGGLAALLLLLALSMFDVYKLQVPPVLRQHVGARRGWVGAVLMGTLAGVAAAPCIGPVIAALIPIVAGLANPWLGFTFFLALGLGLGLPYFVLGLFYEKAQGRLPHSGDWLVLVERLFGLLLIGAAIFFLKSLIPNKQIYNWLWVAFFGFFTVYFLWIEREGESSPKTAKFKHTLGGLLMGLALYSAYALLSAPPAGSIVWMPYAKEQLQEAVRQGKPVLIDFTAEWCAACKELDEKTYTAPQVVQEAQRFVCLKHDSTKSSPAVKAAHKEHQVAGLPTVIFIDSSGQERRDLRLTGFEPPDRFLQRLRQVQ